MRHIRSTTAVAALLLAATPFASAANKYLTASQASACIKHAEGARAGNIKKLEVKVDNNHTICEVHMEDAKGKNFEAHVDVTENKVIRVKD